MSSKQSVHSLRSSSQAASERLEGGKTKMGLVFSHLFHFFLTAYVQ